MGPIHRSAKLILYKIGHRYTRAHSVHQFARYRNSIFMITFFVIYLLHINALHDANIHPGTGAGSSINGHNERDGRCREKKSTATAGKAIHSRENFVFLWSNGNLVWRRLPTELKRRWSMPLGQELILKAARWNIAANSMHEARFRSCTDHFW